LAARQEASLVEFIRAPAPAAGQHDRGADVADHQPGAVRVAQARAQRQHRVVHRAVVQPTPIASLLATERLDKAAQTVLVEVAQTLFRCEIRQRVGDEQAAVLAAGAIVDDVMSTATGVVIDPLQRLAVQGRPGATRGLLCGGPDLDLTRRPERRRRSPALAAILDIDGHPPRAARIHARRRRAHQRRRHLRAAHHCHPHCHPATFAMATGDLRSPATTSDSASESERAREDSNL
jgi:hypothetical protein